MGDLGGLYGMIMGQKGLADMEAKRRYDTDNAEKIRQFNVTSGENANLHKRAYPSPTEIAAEIGNVAGQGDPTALSNLFMFEGKHTPDEMESIIGKNKAEAEYYKQAAGQKDNSGEFEGRKLDLAEKVANAKISEDKLKNFTNRIKANLAPGYQPSDYDEKLFEMAGPKANMLFKQPNEDPGAYKNKILNILKRADDVESGRPGKPGDPIKAEILRGTVRHIQNAQPDLFPSSVQKPGMLDQIKHFLGGASNPDEQIQ